MLHFLGFSNCNLCFVSDRNIKCSHFRESNYIPYARFNSDLNSKLVTSISYIREQLNSTKWKSSSMALKLLKLRFLRNTKSEEKSEIIKNTSPWRIIVQCLDAETESCRRKRIFLGHSTDGFVSLIQDYTSENLPHLTKDFPPLTEDFLPLIKSKLEFNIEGPSRTSVNNLIVKDYWQISHKSRGMYLFYVSRRHPSTFSKSRLRLSLRVTVSSDQSRTFFPP